MRRVRAHQAVRHPPSASRRRRQEACPRHLTSWLVPAANEVAAGRRQLKSRRCHRVLEEIAKPATTRRDQATAELRSLEIIVSPTQQLIELSDHAGRARWLCDLDEALGDWQEWATGRTVSPARLARARSILEDHITPENPAWAALANVLPPPPKINIAQRPLGRPHTPERDIGIGIA